jgi:iron(III) transport system ATP-binding protein
MTTHQALAGAGAGPAGSPAAPALVVHDLALSFGDHVVLDGASLAVSHGEVVALVGPSGCGKTTLVRTVAGFEHADAGIVELAGRVVGRSGSGAAVHVAPERRRVGVVPQEGALFPHLDVAGNIGFGLRSPSPGRWPHGRSWSCSTSRSPRSTPRFGSRSVRP